MSATADKSKQAPNSGQPDASGGNSVGATLKAPTLFKAASFQDRSGQSDNQSTSRGKGRT